MSLLPKRINFKSHANKNANSLIYSKCIFGLPENFGPIIYSSYIRTYLQLNLNLNPICVERNFYHFVETI